MGEFEQFVVVASPRLVRTARLLLGSANEAEDVVQETLIVMYRRWRRLRDPDAAQAYAYRTVVRLARRHRQRSRFRHEIPVDITAEPAAAVVEPEVRAADLARALTKLGTRQRETIVLRFYLDLSVEDTARVMHCTEGTVKSQTSRAIAALRAELDPARNTFPEVETA